MKPINHQELLGIAIKALRRIENGTRPEDAIGASKIATKALDKIGRVVFPKKPS